MSWTNRILLAVFAVVAVAWLPGQLSEPTRGDDLSRVRSEREALVEGNEALRGEIEQLQAEVRALQVDPAAAVIDPTVDREIERVAREDLNLVRTGEVVFEFRTTEDK